MTEKLKNEVLEILCEGFGVDGRDFVALQDARAIALRITDLIKPTTTDEVYIVFDGPPGPDGGRFVEVETADGFSFLAGEWVERPDACWALVLRSDVFERSAETARAWAEKHPVFSPDIPMPQVLNFRVLDGAYGFRDVAVTATVSLDLREPAGKRYDQCDETCTVDCGHCKGAGKPDVSRVERYTEAVQNAAIPARVRQVMAVADAELATVVAERDALRGALDRQATLLRAVHDYPADDPGRMIFQADRLAGEAIIRADRAEATLAKVRDVTREHWDWKAGRLLRAAVMEALGLCPVCTWPERETVGLVCQACGRDFGAILDADPAPEAPIEATQTGGEDR